MYGLETNEYSIQLSKPYGMKLAVVADLHERPYDDIVEALKSIKSDLILLPGDTLERLDEGHMGFTKTDIDEWQQTSTAWRFARMLLNLFGLNKKNDFYAKSNNGINFIKAASKVAPVVMSVGNHEWSLTEDDYKILRECGVVLLDNMDQEITINGRKLLFGGLSTRYDLKWLEGFLKKEQDKILLCHHPEYVYRHINSRLPELVISGHAHGGQVRFKSKGLFAPGQGLFPTNTKGLYGKHLVSAGVSNTAFLPRINNPREVCIINV